jgi:uncharacterized membrane protein YeaQ/YmgE (transglycosylase-associated protein family)
MITLIVLMSSNSLLYTLIVGGIAGWLAGLVMKGGGFGIIGNIIVGILGGVFGGWLFGQLGVSIGNGLVGDILGSGIGAVVLLFIIGLIKK